jgi:hypothetical protein
VQHLNAPQGINFSLHIKAACLAAVLVLCCASDSTADEASGGIMSRPELALSLRHQLAVQLRQITGLKGLGFDEQGALSLGDIKPDGGSQTARELLAEAFKGKKMIVLEDASRREDVAFCRVMEGKWTTGADRKPPVYIVLIDFADFSHVMGDRAALAAFNAGWGVLHEVEHVVHDSLDAERAGKVGDCESLINRMRRECGLAERSDYYFAYVPGTTNNAFKTQLVRMAFERQEPESRDRKRYWLIWDASLVGGLPKQRQVAALR